MSQRTSSFKRFINQSLIGGLTVLLPVIIVLLLIRWIYTSLTDIMAPFSSTLQDWLNLNQFEANSLILLVLVLVCFLLGNFVSTRAGDWLWKKLESWMVRRIPGYRMVNDLVSQLVGNNRNKATRRGEVANIWLYGRDAGVCLTGLITARHDDDRVTVFIPCGPNPTTGYIYHVSNDLVDLCPHVRVEQLMKMAVACGVGSRNILDKNAKNHSDDIASDATHPQNTP